MSPIEELLVNLRNEIATAEVEVAMELVRMDDEHRERKNQRWRRMLDETRALRKRYDSLVQELAASLAHSPPVIEIS